MQRKGPSFGHSFARGDDKFRQILLNYRSQKISQETNGDKQIYMKLIDKLLSLEQKADESHYNKWVAMLDEVKDKTPRERIKVFEKINKQMNPSKRGIFNFFKR